jgi:L-2,4-diaminobutyric acid acetyltransferase
VNAEVSPTAATRPASPDAGPGSSAAAIRTARRTDGPAVWRLVRESGVLDVNSLYCYLLFCDHFGATSVVAEVGGEVVGFVTAFRPPGRSQVIFVWQVGVDAAWRGRGIAGRLLRSLVGLEACSGVTHLETTIAPSNHASQALFRSLARRLGTVCQVSPYFGEELFGGDGHEAEELYRIGPFTAPRSFAAPRPGGGRRDP